MKKHFISWIVLAALLFFAPAMQAKVIKLLTIGNSFSEDAVEQNLYELALEGGDVLIIGNAYRGGQGFQSHWNVVQQDKADFEYRKVVDGVRTNTPGKKLLDCLLDENWDYITFQQVSQDSGMEGTYEPYLTLLLGYVKEHATNPDVKYGLHQTWAYSQDSGHGGFANYGRDQQTMYEAIVNAINKAYNDHKGEFSFIVPAGTAIQNGRTSFIGDHFNRDGYHLSYGLGRYTAACTWLEIITGQSPVGKTFFPSSITDVEAAVAQHSAHAAVAEPNKVTPMNNFGYEGDNTVTPAAAVKINFGVSAVSAEGWNNVTTGGKYVLGLKDVQGNDTEIIAILDDDFSGTNTEGEQTTETELDMPLDVSKSALWGYNKGSFGGGSFQETGGLLFSHLNKELVYDFYFFGSRKNSSDNRETEYMLQGDNRKRNYVDAASNKDRLAVVRGIKPTSGGEIRLTVTAGPNNTNGNAFYYLNAMQIVARPYAEGDFDDDELDPMIPITAGQPYYIRHIDTGLYLRAQAAEGGDFSLARIDRNSADFHFQFIQTNERKPLYNLMVNDRYLNGGAEGTCVLGDATDANGQVRLEASEDLTEFKMIAPWNASPNYMNFKNPTIGSQLLANRGDGASFRLIEAAPLSGLGEVMSRSSVYPSLCTGTLQILTETAASVRILNSVGQVMDVFPCDGALSVELDYPDGLYLVQVGTSPAETHKVLLKR